MHTAFIQQVIEMAADNVRRNGGPFAALVVKDGIVIAAGTNQVTRNNDPTAHAEIVAIREACRVLGDFQLAGCDVYSSCEPCPMCLGALYWARPERIFFAATHDDAAAAGFDDRLIYQELQLPLPDRSIPTFHISDCSAARPFNEWRNKGDKTPY
jgi:guanine deaminase